jgi:hypothetical protein
MESRFMESPEEFKSFRANTALGKRPIDASNADAKPQIIKARGYRWRLLRTSPITVNRFFSLCGLYFNHIIHIKYNIQ